MAKIGVDTATGFAHNKVHQVEKENSGVESAHKSEETLEGLYRFSKGRKKTREKSARAEKKVEVEKKSSRLKFSESEGGMAEEVAEMKQQRQLVQNSIRKSSIRMPMQQPSEVGKLETLPASRRQRRRTRLPKKQKRRCRKSLCRTRPCGRDLASQH